LRYVNIEHVKKFIIIIIVIGAIVILYTMRDNSPIDNAEKTTTGENSNFQPNPSNATFLIDGESITLSAGRNERIVAPGSVMTEETVALDKFAYGDINLDGKSDTVLLLARYGGGSGIFIYAAAFVSGPVTYRGSNAIFIGDRIDPQSISINNGVVTVNYLDRGPQEAFSTEPTIPASKQFAYKNGEFVER
jgi:hypothetical protein